MINEEIKLTAELTDEEIQAYSDKADMLAKEKNISKVHPIVQINPDTLERKVCYISEPNYVTKLAVMDKSITVGPYIAGEELRQACLIKEASDPITYGDSPECDRYKLGVVDYCILMVKRLKNQFKKK
jgi:hypothetical protein